MTGANLYEVDGEYCRDNKVALPAFNCTPPPSTPCCRPQRHLLPGHHPVPTVGPPPPVKATKNTSREGQHTRRHAGAQHVQAHGQTLQCSCRPTIQICAKKLLPGSYDMIEANEEYFKANGEPLFHHMLDLSLKNMTRRTSPPAVKYSRG